jgi:signal transduction histidine kinase/DNA-binding response OmpR family regulator/ligand-binding sensor domain-containing protein
MCARLCRNSWFTGFLIQLVGLTAWSAAVLNAQSFSLPQPEIISAQEGLPQAFVPSIVQDHQGFIWMATRDGLCRYDGHQFKVFQPTTNGLPALSSPGLVTLQTDNRGRIWILSDQYTIDVFDPMLETFVNFSKRPFFERTFRGFIIRSIFTDQQNRLWITLDEKGIACINLTNNRIRWFRHLAANPYSLSSDGVRGITEDQKGNIWIVTSNGLTQLPKNTERFRQFHHQPGQSTSLPAKELLGVQAANNGNLLLLSANHLTLLNPLTGQCRNYFLPEKSGAELANVIKTDSRGNYYFNRKNLLFRYNEREGIQPFPQQSKVNEYIDLFIDRSGVLWAGTNGLGVRKFNLRAGSFQVQLYQTNFCADLLVNHLGMSESQRSLLPPDLYMYNFRYAFDQQGKLWFNAGRTPFYQFDLQTKRLTPISFPVEISSKNNADQPIPLATDPAGRIWAVYDTLVKWYEHGNWYTFKYPIRPGVESVIRQVVVDQKFLWLATSKNGLYRVDRFNGQIQQYAFQPNNETSLSNNTLYSLFADPLDSNLLWIGTFGSGLCRFDKRTGQCRRLTTRDGLPNNVVYAAIPDRQGSVWVATNQGIGQVNRNTFQTRTYTQEDGLLANEYNRFHNLHLPGLGTADDRIILGGLEGITAFSPGQIREDGYHPAVQITSIFINNRLLTPAGNSSVPESQPAQAIGQLELSHDQNFVTVNFAAMQYNRRNKIRYRYQLEGLSKGWIETEQPSVIYTDLRPGHYVFRLNASNTSGLWSRHIRTLTIAIQPPWWNTWWAWIFYSLVLLSVVYSLHRVYLNRLKLRQSLALKQKEIELKQKETLRLREIDEMKTRFFSNITHEFRTPLTLILSPTEQMMEEPRQPEDRHRLALIDRNAQQLLGLINQLLDLSQIEAGAMKITPVQANLAEVIDQITQSFQSISRAKMVRLTFQNQLGQEYLWFDPQKLERIVYNLLSNALRFTPAGGEVKITALNSSDQDVQLVVSDTGIGIPADKLPQIFNHFYQVDDSSTRRQDGTGIGLSLVKELVELQVGTIQVTSQVGEGTIFTVQLPYRSVTDTDDSIRPLALDMTYHSGYEMLEPNESGREVPVILLVEDNAELADFISDGLASHYRVRRAANGAKGLIEAERLMPDLVISDILMPVMDGYTLCTNLKRNLQTSHIPVILLTAKVDLDSRIEGLTVEADDYLTKPFHFRELQLRVRNLLNQQQRLRDWLRTDLNEPGVGLTPRPVFSDPFFEEIYSLLDENLDDSTFGVEELTKRIGMSRSSLHRKLRLLTDLSAVELIRNYRLKRAAEFLNQGRGGNGDGLSGRHRQSIVFYKVLQGLL